MTMTTSSRATRDGARDAGTAEGRPVAASRRHLLRRERSNSGEVCVALHAQSASEPLLKQYGQLLISVWLSTHFGQRLPRSGECARRVDRHVVLVALERSNRPAILCWAARPGGMVRARPSKWNGGRFERSGAALRTGTAQGFC
jgi:hypothetical protein